MLAAGWLVDQLVRAWIGPDLAEIGAALSCTISASRAMIMIMRLVADCGDVVGLCENDCCQRRICFWVVQI